MRLGYVLKRYPRYSETFVVNEILAHEAAGVEVEIFALRPPADSHFQDAISRVRAPVSYLPFMPVKATVLWAQIQQSALRFSDTFAALATAGEAEVQEVHQAMALAEMATGRGITHLHAHFATSAATVARLASRIGGVPWSFTAHAKDIFHESVRTEDLATKLREAAVAITVSDYNLEYLRQRFGGAAGRLRRVFNGLDLDRFGYSAPREREPLVLAVGRLVEKKGFDVLIDAAAVLAGKGVSFRCEIVGAGLQREALEQRIASLGLERRVLLLGPEPQAEVIRRMRRASVLAVPCVVSRDGDRDGLPTVLLEAMALGTPVVSSPVTGIPEVVRDGRTGLLVREGDPVALADALARLLADAGLRERLAGGARALVEAEFDVARNAALLRHAITDATGARP